MLALARAQEDEPHERRIRKLEATAAVVFE
jgi:hypothetical protein